MTVRREERDGIAILTLDRPPANAFDPELVASLRSALDGGAGARAVLLTSALPSMFSAGWDLPVLVSFDRPKMEAFVDSYCDLVRQIFAFPAPVVVALPGHAIAGGMIVAAATDERLAASGKGQFGLSEVVLGIPLPRCCHEVFRYVIGARAAERLVAAGENYSGEIAAEIGLVDRIVPAEELQSRALDRARFLAERSRQAHAATKAYARASAVARFDEGRRGDPFLDFWFAADARQRIGALVAKLSKK